MKRDRRIDSIRGMLLVIMTVDHIGGPLAQLTDQPFGYVSALSGFIFVSGFLYASVNWPLATNPKALWSKSAARAWRIYRYHLALLLLIPFLLTVSALHAQYLQELVRPMSLDSRFGYYFAMAALLVHLPVFMDILPMYAIFVLVSPVIIWALRRGEALLVVLVTCLMWLGAGHLNPTQALSRAVCDECRYGYVNLLAWQLIWVLGMLVAWWGMTSNWRAVVLRPAIVACAAVFATGLLLIRHGLVTVPLGAAVDLNRLGVLRFVNLALLLIIIVAAIERVPRDKGIPWLGFVGRFPLQVFAFQVGVAYLLLPYVASINRHTGLLGYAVATLLVVASLSIPAYWQRWRSKATASVVQQAG